MDFLDARFAKAADAGAFVPERPDLGKSTRSAEILRQKRGR
jgi:hypothetical protein